MRFSTPLALALLATAGSAAILPAAAQARDTTAGPTLTLEEALSLASRNNSDLLQSVNARRRASAAVRAAYGDLLPRADAQFSSRFQQGGTQPINGVTFQTGDIRQSSYFVGLQYQLSPATIIAPRAAAATQDATEAEVVAMSATVRGTVAQQYLQALRAEATADMQDSLVKTAEAQLELARAKASVGSGTQLDVTRAEVTLGQQRVAALNARSQVEIEKLRLFQQMGVSQPASVQLTSRFAVTEPTFKLEELLDMARRQNPGLEALRSRDKAASVGVKQAHAQYLPTLSLSTGVGGYTYQNTNPNFLIEQARAQGLRSSAQCGLTNQVLDSVGLGANKQNCSAFLLTPSDEAAIREQNSVFPFDFTRQPRSIQATISLPLFDNFSREQRIQEAQASRNDARIRVKARELELNQGITAAYLTLVTAQKTVQLQEQNVAKASEELRLTEERYRVGAGTFLDVTTSRGEYERALTDRINAIYDYHRAFAALESAVGRPLR